jgi:hypothetical protein
VSSSAAQALERICRSLMPIISTTCRNVIFPEVARNNTSSIFIARYADTSLAKNTGHIVS